MRLLKFYKKYISPSFVFLFGHSCRFEPTCSEYAAGAVAKHGFLKGGILAIWRILRCNPLTKPGFDPVS